MNICWAQLQSLDESITKEARKATHSHLLSGSLHPNLFSPFFWFFVYPNTKYYCFFPRINIILALFTGFWVELPWASPSQDNSFSIFATIIFGTAKASITSLKHRSVPCVWHGHLWVSIVAVSFKNEFNSEFEYFWVSGGSEIYSVFQSIRSM